MRAKDAGRLGTIRLLRTVTGERTERVTLNDAAVIAIVDKLIQAAQDSIAAFEGRRPPGPGRQGKRPRWRCCELPARAHVRSRDRQAVQAIVAVEVGAKGPGDMGR